MPSVRLTRGTKEIVPVDISDRTSTVTDLSASSPTFTVQADDNTYKYNAVATTASGMRINPLIDTNNGGLWAAGHYRLFVSFTVGSEVVVLGPIDLYVVST